MREIVNPILFLTKPLTSLISLLSIHLHFQPICLVGFDLHLWNDDPHAIHTNVASETNPIVSLGHRETTFQLGEEFSFDDDLFANEISKTNHAPPYCA